MDRGISGDALSASLARMIDRPGELEDLYGLLGQYCHQCRNLLHTIKLGLFLARRSSAPCGAERLGLMEREYTSVETFFERLQTICRPLALRPVRMPLDLLIQDRLDTWTGTLAARGLRLEAVPPAEPAFVAYDPGRLGQALDALVEWRSGASEPGGAIVLSWRAEGGELLLGWSEGPADAASPAPAGPPGADTLALPLLLRIVAAHGGSVDIPERARGRCHITVRWPVDARHP